MNSNVQSIAASFDIKSLGRDSSGAVIEVTDYINGDNEILFLAVLQKVCTAWVLCRVINPI